MASESALHKPPRVHAAAQALYPPPRHIPAELPASQPLQPGRCSAPRLAQIEVGQLVFDIDARLNPRERSAFAGKDALYRIHPPPSPAPAGRREPKDDGLRPVLVFTTSAASNATLGDASPADESKTCGAEPSWAEELQFEARFESGNLARAERLFSDRDHYQLWIRPDSSTKGHAQWFYFAVANGTPGATYRFSIVNCVKRRSLFGAKGMQPMVYSTRAAEQSGVGWVRRGGAPLSYHKNARVRAQTKSGRQKHFYTLTFDYEWQFADDVVYLAYSKPFTYTDLQLGLHGLLGEPERLRHVQLGSLCVSPAGYDVPLITVSAGAGDAAASRERGSPTKEGRRGRSGGAREPAADWDFPLERKAVVVTARCHPGETSSSFVMEGLLEFLSGPSDEVTGKHRHRI